MIKKTRNAFMQARKRKFLSMRPILIIFIVLILLQSGLLPIRGQNKEPASVQQEKDNQEPIPRELGEPQSIAIYPSFGSVSDSIPIVVSPGRRNFEPQLALTYSSSVGLGDA